MKRICVIGPPLLAGHLSSYLLQIADTAMVGRLGREPLAAIAIATMVGGILSTFVWPVTVGTQAITARRFGRQNAETERPLPNASSPDSSDLERATGAVLVHGIWAGFGAAAVALLASLFVPAVLRFLLPDDGIVSLAWSYVRIYRWSLPLLGYATGATGFLSAIHKTSAIMVSNILGNLVNILFNYLLIFGKWGFPRLGIEGAAIGTVIAQALCSLYLLLPLLPGKLRMRYRFFSGGPIDFRLLAGIYRTGFPTGIQNLIALFIFLVYESLVGTLGTLYLAATHIAFSAFRINKTIIGGFSRGSAILVGNALGAGDPRAARDTIIACQVLSAVVASLILAAILLFSEPIARFFTTDEETVRLGGQALLFFSGFFFIEVLGYSFEIVFTNNGWGAFVLFSEFTTNILFIFCSTLLALRVFGWGIYGAWISFGLYQVFHAVILLCGFLSGKWKNVEVELRARPEKADT